MTELVSFFLSPQGMVLFVALWLLKAAFGVWLAFQAIQLLPAHLQARPMKWLQSLTPKASHGVLMGHKTKAPLAQDDISGDQLR